MRSHMSDATPNFIKIPSCVVSFKVVQQMYLASDIGTMPNVSVKLSKSVG